MPTQTGVTFKLSSGYTEFWNWFSQQERSFFNIVQARQRVHEDFFEVLAPALDRVKEGFYFQTGVFDGDTVELVISAEGAIENIVFAEELVHAAPVLPG